MLALALLPLCLLGSAALYDSMKSEVAIISAANWMSQVVKGRQNENVVLLHFFNAEDAQSVAFAKEFTAKAAEYKGIYVFGYVDCRQNRDICRKEGVAELPALRVYPPLPLPFETLPLDVKAALARASRFVKAYLTEVDGENLSGFLNTDVTLPKVLYFTDKPGSSLLVRSLSRNFNKKLSFGVVRSSAADVVKAYGVKQFPALMVLRSNQKKPFIFAKDFSYKETFEFLNFFSEQFAPTADEKASETKPWLFEGVPELSDKSAADVCLTQEKTLCVILFAPEKPAKEVLDALKTLKADFDNKLDRAASYRFMWINAQANAKWAAEFKVEDTSQLAVRVLNPGRRKRYTALEGPFSAEAVERLLEKISGGDARFVNLGTDLPDLSAEL